MGPLVLVPLGLGGLGSVLAVSLGRYRLVFTILALLLLGVGHYLIYKRKNAKITDRIVLWVSTAAVMLILVLF